MSILDQFPKTRVELPSAYAEIYSQHYFHNRNGQYTTTSLSQRLEAWMHRQVAADLQLRVHRGDQERLKKIATLEVGAGTLNQLSYEPVMGRYDIVEPFTELYEGSALLSRVGQTFADIEDVPLSPRYQRITSIATFEHIIDLPKVVAAAAKRLTDDGQLRVAIPNEGTSLWKLGTMITGFEFKRRYGLDYQQLMRYEHVNQADEIEQVLQYYFENCRRRVFGLNRRLALYRFYECTQVKLSRLG